MTTTARTLIDDMLTEALTSVSATAGVESRIASAAGDKKLSDDILLARIATGHMILLMRGWLIENAPVVQESIEHARTVMAQWEQWEKAEEDQAE